MKYFVIIILSYFPVFAISQNFRSEYIKYKSCNQIRGDKLIRTDSVVLQINDRKGDHDAKIAVHYSKGDKITIGNAWIEDMQGNIVRKLKNKEIEDISSISDMSLYEDDFVKTFELKHNSYPYRIIYSFKVTYSKFLSAASINYANSLTPVREGELVVETPIERPINYKQQNVNEPDIETTGSDTRYTWKYSYAPPIARELNSSPNSSKAPLIHVVPVHFKYGIRGSKESWKSFGNWVFELNKGKDELPLSEQTKIDKLLSGITDDKMKAKVLYQYLQDYTRYINVNINIGGLQTYPASYVCTNRYGDCKALTNYMQAILKYAGIKSYYTLINAGDEIIDVDMDFPSQVFNHVILTIPFGSDTTYLECTSKNTPFGYMGVFTQGRKALLIDENKSHFVNIPGLGPDNVLCTRTICVDLMSSGMKLVSRERGYNYEQSNYLVSDINKNIVDKYFRNNILTGSYDLVDFKINKINRDNALIEWTADCKLHNFYKEYGNNLIINPFPLEIPAYETPQKRTLDLQLDYPEFYEDTIVYILPESKKIKLPNNINMESRYGTYSIKYEYNNNQMYIYKSILILPGRYNLSEYKEFYDFVMSVRNIENKKTYIEYL